MPRFPRVLSLLALLAFAAAPLRSAAPPPNLIFILSDDLAQGDLGVYGQRLIRTPRLDRMAREGTRYTQAYSGTTAPGSGSVIELLANRLGSIITAISVSTGPGQIALTRTP